MSIEYRLAKTEDQDAFYEFALEVSGAADIPDFAKDAGEGLQNRLLSGETSIVVALDGQRIIGYAELDVTRRPNSVYLKGIYVLPSHRRKGIGGQIIKKINDELSQNKVVRVDAFTHEGRHFWETLGFKVHHYSMEFH